MKRSPKAEKPRRSIGAQRNALSTSAILLAAETVLREDGYKGFSIEKVARKARSGKPTIYRWWPNKTALLLDVYLHQKQFNFTESGHLEADLTQFILTIFKFWRETPGGTIFRSVIAEAQTDSEAAAVFAEFAKVRRIETSSIIRRAQLRKEVRANIDAEVVADFIASWMWSHLLTDRLTDDDSLTRQAVEMLTRGIAVRTNPSGT
jgi:AcrR family transcriptional regulator